MKRLALLLFVALLAGCGGALSRSSIPGAMQGGLRGRGGSSPIQHVVIIMQENRSFDNFFYDFPGANGTTYGMGHGVKYPLQPLDLAHVTQDPIHSHWQFLEDYDGGKNDGFDRQIYAFATPPPSQCLPEPENQPKCWIWHKPKVWMTLPYTYVPQKEIQPYWDMATQYTLGDDTFSSNNDESFPAHEYMIAGQSGHASEAPSQMPWGCDAPYEWEYYLQFGSATPPVFGKKVGHEVGYKTGPDPCFPLTTSSSSAYPTIADLLDAAGITWRYYVQPPTHDGHGVDSYWLNAFDAVKSVRYGPDWTKDIATPDTKILKDVANGNLQQVSWVMPHAGASDHAGGGSGSCGPNWVASIVNAIGQSKYWDSTAVIIMWDEWGGWYDHVKPPQYPDPVTGAYEGLGYRIPLIVVS
ncbi:MAG TPA: alkaline phosphatase family protein, partial [Candidatus Tumulicola sp.]|nr:alkaline phosphatase family protein [Candidatus Tumulicola sp.]